MKYFVKVLNCLCLNFHTSQKRLVRRLVSHQSRQFEYISSTNLTNYLLLMSGVIYLIYLQKMS